MLSLEHFKKNLDSDNRGEKGRKLGRKSRTVCAWNKGKKSSRTNTEEERGRRAKGEKTKMTPEKKGTCFIADLSRGLPQCGDSKKSAESGEGGRKRGGHRSRRGYS